VVLALFSAISLSTLSLLQNSLKSIDRNKEGLKDHEIVLRAKSILVNQIRGMKYEDIEELTERDIDSWLLDLSSIPKIEIEALPDGIRVKVSLANIMRLLFIPHSHSP